MAGDAAPCACAASSISKRWLRSAIRRKAVMSAGRHRRCTAMMARVRGVMAALKPAAAKRFNCRSGSRRRLAWRLRRRRPSGSRRGVCRNNNLVAGHQLCRAQNQLQGVESVGAADTVPRAPQKRANSSSNASTSLPRMKSLRSSTRATACFQFGLESACCAVRS